MNATLLTLLVSGCGAVLLRHCRGALDRRVPPRILVPLLTVAVVAIAVAGGIALSSLAFAVLGRHATLAGLGHWSPAALNAALPVPPLIGWLAAVLVTGLAGAALYTAVRGVTDVARAERVNRELGRPDRRVLVLRDENPDAYTIAGLRGRVIVTTGMLRRLPSDERRVVLAHELSHLRHRHHIYLQCAAVAAAANPILRPVVATVRHGAERWADEDAATAVGDRGVAARAIARAGLARHRAEEAVALAATGGRVADRATAMLAPPPAGRLLVAALCSLVLLVGAAGTVNLVAVHGAVEYAQNGLTHVVDQRDAR